MEQNQLRLLENKVEQENIKRSIESARVADESEKQKVEEKGEIYRTFLNKQVQDNDKIRAENKKRLASEIQAEKVRLFCVVENTEKKLIVVCVFFQDMHRKFQDLLKQETEKTIARGR